MKTITILVSVLAIALGLYICFPGLAWQANTQLTNAEQRVPRSVEPK